jgi:hypothetical protein
MKMGLSRISLNLSGNPSNNNAHGKENDHSQNISPSGFTKTANKSNNGGRTYHPDNKCYQPFNSSSHGAIITQQNVRFYCID